MTLHFTPTYSSWLNLVEGGSLRAPRNTVDSLIAANARARGLTVVTRNTGDFEDCGVALINPRQPQPNDPD